MEFAILTGNKQSADLTWFVTDNELLDWLLAKNEALCQIPVRDCVCFVCKGMSLALSISRFLSLCLFVVVLSAYLHALLIFVVSACIRRRMNVHARLAMNDE